jgi:hypothetical protein
MTLGSGGKSKKSTIGIPVWEDFDRSKTLDLPIYFGSKYTVSHVFLRAGPLCLVHIYIVTSSPVQARICMVVTVVILECLTCNLVPSLHVSRYAIAD